MKKSNGKHSSLEGKNDNIKNNNQKHKTDNVQDKKHKRKSNKKKTILITFFSIILIASISYIIYHYYSQWKNKNDMDKLANLMNEINIDAAEESGEENGNKAFLQNLQELKKENSDLIGWLKIEGTNIDYPVVQTTDNDYYVKHSFKKQYSELGAIFLDKDCSLTKPTANFLIYGHNRGNGDQMFATLTKYKKESFYKEHPTFKFSTLEEVSEYQIIAVFQSHVYYKHEDVFKYYFFKDAKNKEEFDNYVNNVKKLSMYDIEETASYGDQLITLSTCDYHVEDGRFAVVAKKIK